MNAEGALVSEGGIADSVDSVECGVDGGVEADRVVGAGDIVVDRRRDYEDGNASLVAEGRRADHRALATDDDQRFDLVPLQIARCQTARGRSAELRRARGFQEVAATLDHIGDA